MGQVGHSSRGKRARCQLEGISDFGIVQDTTSTGIIPISLDFRQLTYPDLKSRCESLCLKNHGTISESL